MVYTVWLCYIVLCILKTAVFNFYIFQQFILIVTLCVGEIREMSVQGVLGHYKAVSMFSSLGHGSFSSLCICLPSPSSALPQNVRVYVYSQCFCFHINPLQLRALGNHSCGFNS